MIYWNMCNLFEEKKAFCSILVSLVNGCVLINVSGLEHLVFGLAAGMSASVSYILIRG